MSCYVWQSHMTQSYDTEKVIEDSGIEDIIQYNYNMLVL